MAQLRVAREAMGSIGPPAKKAGWTRKICRKRESFSYRCGHYPRGARAGDSGEKRLLRGFLLSGEFRPWCAQGREGHGQQRAQPWGRARYVTPRYATRHLSHSVSYIRYPAFGVADLNPGKPKVLQCCREVRSRLEQGDRRRAVVREMVEELLRNQRQIVAPHGGTAHT